jgi:hypothetical protein
MCCAPVIRVRPHRPDAVRPLRSGRIQEMEVLSAPACAVPIG